MATEKPATLSKATKARPKYLTVKFWAFQIHLWLGLAVVVSFTMVGFSGSMLIFDDWLDAWQNPRLHSVTPKGEAKPFSEIYGKFKAELPEAQLASVRPARTADASWVFIHRVPLGEDGKPVARAAVPATTQPAVSEAEVAAIKARLAQRRKQELAAAEKASALPRDAGKAGAARTAGTGAATQPARTGEPRRRFASHEVFIDPYTLTVLGQRNATEQKKFHTFFANMHYYLSMPREPGYRLNGYLGIPTVIVLVSGLILWWPKTIKMLYIRIKVKVSAGYQRMNWDVHNALGFWTLPLLVLVMVTGIYFPFALEIRPVVESWLGKRSEPTKFEIVDRDPELGPVTLDESLANLAKQLPDATVLSVSGFDRGNMQVTVQEKSYGVMFRNTVRIDRETGQLASIERPSNVTDYVLKLIFPLHAGYFFGNWMRYVYFVLGLTPLILSVTGTWIFAHRKLKQWKAWRGSKGKAGVGALIEGGELAGATG